MRYVVVLAKNTTEGNVYARRSNLPRGSYRVATSASSVKGLRVAEIHELPSFANRPDRHAINAQLRYVRGDRVQVEMPARTAEPVVDQGDGFGPQTDVFEQIEAAEAEAAEKRYTRSEITPEESKVFDAPTSFPDLEEKPAPEPAPNDVVSSFWATTFESPAAERTKRKPDPRAREVK